MQHQEPWKNAKVATRIAIDTEKVEYYYYYHL